MPLPFDPGEPISGTNYRVIRKIARGGTGVIYQVSHIVLGKTLVLKRLRKDRLSPEAIQAILDESRALARLEHPNIVGVRDAGFAGDEPYFVMERLVGETLAQRLRARGRLPLIEALRVATLVLDGLHAAHGIGIVHRDVKPDNVFMVEGGGVKLLDFGIARRLTAAGDGARESELGSPRFTAPEQARGAAVDERTDLYAVGLVLFEMITGRGPFDEAGGGTNLRRAHAERTAPHASTFADNIPADLDDLIASALAKDPRRRPESAAAMSAALRDIASLLDTRPSRPSREWLDAAITVPSLPVLRASAGDEDETLVGPANVQDLDETRPGRPPIDDAEEDTFTGEDPTNGDHVAVPAHLRRASTDSTPMHAVAALRAAVPTPPENAHDGAPLKTAGLSLGLAACIVAAFLGGQRVYWDGTATPELATPPVPTTPVAADQPARVDEPASPRTAEVEAKAPPPVQEPVAAPPVAAARRDPRPTAVRRAPPAARPTAVPSPEPVLVVAEPAAAAASPSEPGAPEVKKPLPLAVGIVSPWGEPTVRAPAEPEVRLPSSGL